MPEGDTIFRAAATLRQTLSQAVIVNASSRDEHAVPSARLAGQTVTDVEARGKHLLIHLANGDTIHSHMGMTGSWHVYAVGESWQKPQRQAALQLETERAVVVCFSPKQLEVLSKSQLKRHPWIARLGPDILATTFHMDEALSRFAAWGHLPLGEAVLHQGIVCGIGNVYKSEALFIRRLDPFQPVAKLEESQLRSLLECTRDLMRRNLNGYPRQTRFRTDGQRKWVYDRSGEPCLVCGTSVAMRRQGDLGRSTYYCPECQGTSAG